jgi:hypothetical protein
MPLEVKIYPLVPIFKNVVMLAADWNGSAPAVPLPKLFA